MKAGTAVAGWIVGVAVFAGLACGTEAKREGQIGWRHLSSKKGEIERPNAGTQQTATAVFDVDKDGVNDFLIAERTKAPSVVWYRRAETGWTRYVVEAEPLHIEAGSATCDIDADGDIDVVFGGDSESNRVWWWENPYADYDANKPWKRHTIKTFGGNKHHDQMFGDFDGDGRQELVFWNQGSQRLYLAEIPERPREAETGTALRFTHTARTGRCGSAGSTRASRASTNRRVWQKAISTATAKKTLSAADGGSSTRAGQTSSPT